MAAVGSYSVKCVLTSTRPSEMTVQAVEDHSANGAIYHFPDLKSEHRHSVVCYVIC